MLPDEIDDIGFHWIHPNDVFNKVFIRPRYYFLRPYSGDLLSFLGYTSGIKT
jgi:hypothetical protein